MSAPAQAVEPLIFNCVRAEQQYTETYELRIDPAVKGKKAKVFVDDRDLDRADEMGRQVVKSVVISKDAALISVQAQFLPERFDDIQYGPGVVTTLINIQLLTGRLSKTETIQGGILSATLGDGTRTYQEQCTLLKRGSPQ
jgi:hypothetical protein